jgi:hypothetical protein
MRVQSVFRPALDADAPERAAGPSDDLGELVRSLVKESDEAAA